ncbi:hypothetical protein PHET_11216 [Paragonimus heterotremus]|uniref:IRS-type PTB domain-containing protein n=1 Tax=Paragonimus heterotremus TaxID=100268 RepID=A0A8J4SYK9_9TREM|nr:hypothetical protein PHET_11216 [Paragonimus heterotremus]
MGTSWSAFKSESLESLVNSASDYSVNNELLRCVAKPEHLFEAVQDEDECIKLYEASLLDCQLRVVCKGKVELRSYELIFRDHNTNLKWPLWSLRWYGAKLSLFVFESGRRCPSGPGLFLFKCKHSKQLSSCLAKQISYILKRTVTSNHQISTKKCPHLISSQRSSVERATELRLQTVQHSQLGAHGRGVRYVKGIPKSTSTSCSSNEASGMYCPSSPPSASPTAVNTFASAEYVPTISYPLLVATPQETNDLSTESREEANESTSNLGHYLDFVQQPDSLSVRSQSEGQYLIAAASHPYVNQPNRVLLLAHGMSLGTETVAQPNDYTAEPGTLR